MSALKQVTYLICNILCTQGNRQSARMLHLLHMCDISDMLTVAIPNHIYVFWVQCTTIADFIFHFTISKMSVLGDHAYVAKQSFRITTNYCIYIREDKPFLIHYIENIACILSTSVYWLNFHVFSYAFVCYMTHNVSMQDLIE